MSIPIGARPEEDVTAVLPCPSRRAVTEPSVMIAVAHICAVVGALLGPPRSGLE